MLMRNRNGLHSIRDLTIQGSGEMVCCIRVPAIKLGNLSLILRSSGGRRELTPSVQLSSVLRVHIAISAHTNKNVKTLKGTCLTDN